MMAKEKDTAKDVRKESGKVIQIKISGRKRLLNERISNKRQRWICFRKISKQRR